jgi:hypothetical protein
MNVGAGLITQRSRVQIPPPLPVSAGQGPDRQEAVRPFDRLSAARPRDPASECRTSRPGLASMGIAARGSARRCGLTGTDRGMLLAARAAAAHDRSYCPGPGSPSGPGLDDPAGASPRRRSPGRALPSGRCWWPPSVRSLGVGAGWRALVCVVLQSPGLGRAVRPGCLLAG